MRPLRFTFYVLPLPPRAEGDRAVLAFQVNPFGNLVAARILGPVQGAIGLIYQFFNVGCVVGVNCQSLAHGGGGYVPVVYVFQGGARGSLTDSLGDQPCLGTINFGQYDAELLTTPAPNRVGAL